MRAFDRKVPLPSALLDILRSVRGNALETVELLERVLRDLHFVGPDRVHPQFREIVDRDAEADRARDVRRAALELVRDVVPLGPAEVDLADHLAAAEERFRFLEEFRLAVEDANPRRPQHLVAAER